MKRIMYLFVGIILLGCSTEEATTPNPDPVPQENPKAVDDELSATENTDLVVSNLLTNDDLVDNARIYSIDTETSQGGVLVDNRDGTYTYTPPQDFVGEDTFSYTICALGDLERCSSAQVIINVSDGGSPEAYDDVVSTVQSSSIIIDNLLSNDVVLDGATITYVNSETTQGSVVLNADGTVTYTPSAEFFGEDQFSYTICDNDSPEASCSTAQVNVVVHEILSLNIPASLESYYSDLVLSTSMEMNEEALSTLTAEKHINILDYFERHNYLYDADEDLSNPDNVILMYTGESRYWKEYTSGSNSYSPQTFNTEHVYPQSKFSAPEAKGDLHHLRVADAGINSKRSNYPFVEGSGDAGLVTSSTWYPGDEWKGDVARMVMYLNIRYGEIFEQVGSLELFLQWNVEDPVSAFELQRQEVIINAQGNRNPFIDNPYLATLIWGGPAAENSWE